MWAIPLIVHLSLVNFRKQLSVTARAKLFFPSWEYGIKPFDRNIVWKYAGLVIEENIGGKTKPGFAIDTWPFSNVLSNLEDSHWFIAFSNDIDLFARLQLINELCLATTNDIFVNGAEIIPDIEIFEAYPGSG